MNEIQVYDYDIRTTLVCFLVMLILYALFGRKKMTFFRGMAFCLYVTYIVTVLGVTLSPIPLNLHTVQTMRFYYYDGYEWYNFKLFNTLLYYEYGVSQFILNILMFVPFGLLYPFAKDKFSFGKVLIMTMLFTLLIEGTQLALAFICDTPQWYFDVDDLLANTLGGILGYILAIIIKPAFYPYMHKRKRIRMISEPIEQEAEFY